MFYVIFEPIDAGGFSCFRFKLVFMLTKTYKASQKEEWKTGRMFYNFSGHELMNKCLARDNNMTVAVL